MEYATLKLPSLFSIALLSVWTGNTYATEQCGPDAVDPDNDGWGWENGKSCKIGDVKPPHPFCTGPDADPDGDGYGWENDATCIVDNDDPVVPGNSYSTALPIQMDELISANMSGSEEHFFRVELSTPTAYSITTNFLIDGALTVRIDTGQSTNHIYWSGEWGSYDSSPKGCLSAGTYYLRVDRGYNFTFTDITYNFTLNEADMQCKSQSATVPLPEYLDQISFLDDVFYYSDYYTLKASDITGAELWSTVIGEYQYIDNITPLSDSTVIITTASNNFHLIDSIGQIKWSRTLGKSYYGASSTREVGDSILIDVSGTMYSVNKGDGSIRWASTYGVSSSYGNNIKVTDDNRIILIRDGEARIFDN